MAKKTIGKFSDFDSDKIMNGKELIKFLMKSKTAKDFRKGNPGEDDDETDDESNEGITPEYLSNSSDSGFEISDLEKIVGPIQWMEDEVADLGMTGPQDDEAGTSWKEVIFFKKHNVYLMISGWDDSQGNGEIEDEYLEVVPQKITVTVYKPKK